MGDTLWQAWGSWDTGGGKRAGARGDSHAEQSRSGIIPRLEEWRTLKSGKICLRFEAHQGT